MARTGITGRRLIVEGSVTEETDMHGRVFEVFDMVAELAAPARAAFLDDACRDDQPLRHEVHSLLDAFDSVRTEALFPPLGRMDDVESYAVGQRVGPYTLARQIGEGGMGVVFEATRDDLEKIVAIKLVRHGRLASAEQLRRFRLEQRVLARLEHANIAHLLDAGVMDSGLPFLVMEYVEGDPIDRYCNERGLTVEQRLVLFGQICDAVQYAHRHLVVHRDLKPSNILVTSDGMVKLLDFGIATLLTHDRRRTADATAKAEPAARRGSGHDRAAGAQEGARASLRLSAGATRGHRSAPCRTAGAGARGFGLVPLTEVRPAARHQRCSDGARRDHARCGRDRHRGSGAARGD